MSCLFHLNSWQFLNTEERARFGACIVVISVGCSPCTVKHVRIFQLDRLLHKSSAYIIHSMFNRSSYYHINIINSGLVKSGNIPVKRQGSRKNETLELGVVVSKNFFSALPRYFRPAWIFVTVFDGKFRFYIYVSRGFDKQYHPAFIVCIMCSCV